MFFGEGKTGGWVMKILPCIHFKANFWGMFGVKSDFWHVRHDGPSQVLLMFNSVKTFGFKRICVFLMLLHPQSGPLVVTSRVKTHPLID